MKQFVASILLMLIVFQAFYPGVFTGWFYANRAAIARQYCVNKQRPQLHCEGKCYLTGKIQAAEEKQARQESAGPRNMWVETSPAIITMEVVNTAYPLNPLSHFPNSEVGFTNKGHLLSVFRPPSITG